MRSTLEAEDALTEFLAGIFGTPASCWHDAKTGDATVSVFLRQKPERCIRAQIRQSIQHWKGLGLNTGPCAVALRRLHAQDWAESWKRHFASIEISSALLIRPSWGRRRPRRGQQEIVIDPGLSFGTGQHPTTAFCLEQIVGSRDRARAQSFLDIGTGSGILAIAAAKLGYRPVAAFDYDSESVKVARQNARANSVSRRTRIWRRDLKQLPLRAGSRYSLICANLLATLLIEERDRIVSMLLPGGKLVVAGILNREFPQVRRAYAELGLKVVSSRREKEWRSGVFEAQRRVKFR